ncbi:MAG: histidine--tRNA ligase [Omnitrophica WOR_2 bacterium GWF2_38_59]|nr:MAG: histidine--tRNA ligase [Omnitrophica WOR_2 bacterium GWA2_37_7]OGX25172.1 MAG: histidine--tRNA ligase [Omnitrophica WOR_2 bacterium GWF2_38_59]OGX50637.1 MAG: histidine--tRNA ligase [Omnitrophica WOR_2 bacterium RIFOXYA2_FULL_38_17]OGX54633.1 MAG: histidine--tRNA ligase [Omnitrophica WOR_2 bacterium RIFOXYA12_FULL_38_10]OGX56182.1 MAG: histidine--tRNA ligase [Omnitrophica WOR_2 bacterium RIFOXYC2_FULL_38_12]OGX57303.1 MAG: histidine--tRNA ligase [Omnitrophica WOR_2 bacterium RIFOXYB2_F
MSKKFSVPRGTNDILPEDSPQWQMIELKSREILKNYNYKEIRTPIFEETELFARSMGQTSDIVQKQMLNLASQRKDENENIQLSGLSLRPENTASVVRSYVQNSMDRKESLTKLFYFGPMFRGERPQKGRLRQFHQVGVEAIGPNSASPYLDAEVISLSVEMLKSFGLNTFKLKINTLGSPEDKNAFSGMLRDKLCVHLGKLCDDCKLRFERNVFRILDCKDKECKDIVKSIDLDHSYLSKESSEYYSEVKKTLDTLGIEYEESLDLVRGLDYYTHIVFEISDSSLGSQDALGAGGRYNDLVSQLGGAEVDAVGFALGIERIILARQKVEVDKLSSLSTYVIALDYASMQKAFTMLNVIRNNCISSDMSFGVSSLKSQMRAANKAGAQFVLIFGEDEVSKNTVTIKDMREGSQRSINDDEVVQYLTGILKR